MATLDDLDLREREKALALATRDTTCPKCGLEIGAPPKPSAIEFSCDDCGETLRLEPDGAIRTERVHAAPPWLFTLHGLEGE
jgi:hypothetical protein